MVKKMTSYSILGLGAIGGCIAIKLHEAGHKVHCLMSSRSYPHVKKNGFELKTEKGITKVKLPVYKNIDEMPECDFLLITLKSTNNNILKNILPKISKKKTIIVNMQNGIGVEKHINQFIDENKIIGANCLFIGVKTNPGKFIYITPKSFNMVKFAQYFSCEKNSGINDNIKKIANDFSKSGFETFSEDSLTTLRWSKLITNIPVNGLSVALNCSIQEIIKNPNTYKLFCDILMEVTQTARKCSAKLSLKDC